MEAWPAPAGWILPPAPVEAPLPRTIARAAVGFAAVGLGLSWIPILTWFGAILLITGLVLAIVALASPRQGGPAHAGVALGMSLLGLIVSLAVSIPSFLLVTGALDPLALPAESPIVAEDEAAPSEQLDVIETAFGRDVDSAGAWWYTAVIENPNEDWIYSEEIKIEAVAADGSVLQTLHVYPMLLQGTSAVAGTFLGLGEAEVHHIDVTPPPSEDATLSPRLDTGSFVIEDVAGAVDGATTVVTGTVRADFYEENRRVPLIAIVRGADGVILGAERIELGLLPPDDEPVGFEIPVPGVFPDGSTFEVYASL